ncbi:helix-turn-helix domain-containing protein [Oceanobacillus damuensis]|uniref:helix-turn-helix domain-containing protein n=1 Tax=Oceanobacillus damuensis TaxID=937928 RepID=UPI00083485F5|nr:helix-turn-helix transcriptional regulator [Oceanobacillus damuensis]
MTHIGEKIKKRRKERKLTLADVAKDQMSPAMISLIENGKSKPSAENLQHIAKQLDVNVSEFLEGMTKDELKIELSYIEELLEGIQNEPVLEKAISHMKGLISGLGSGFESGRIYEIYSHCLFQYYLLYKPQYDLLEDGNWEKYAIKAENIYKELQMENRVLKMRFFNAMVESSQGNYQKALEQIHTAVNQIYSENDYDTVGVIIDLLLLKFDILQALGEVEKNYEMLDELIRFSNKHLMLHRFFEIYNRGAFMYYNENDFQKAREYTAKIEKFFEIIDNEQLYLDKEMILIHYVEFFENKPEKALKMIKNYEEKVSQLPEAVQNSFADHISDAKARCYTKLKEPREALSRFTQHIQEGTKHLGVHPMDAAIREITTTYRALCYMKIGEIDKAFEYAQEGVNRLRRYPHTAYYQFARKVLHDIQVIVNY